MNKKYKMLQLKTIFIFFIKNLYAFIPRPPIKAANLQEKPLALKRAHFLTFFWVIFAHLDPDPDPADQNQSGSMRIRINNTAVCYTLLFIIIIDCKYTVYAV